MNEDTERTASVSDRDEDLLNDDHQDDADGGKDDTIDENILDMSDAEIELMPPEDSHYGGGDALMDHGYVTEPLPEVGEVEEISLEEDGGGYEVLYTDDGTLEGQEVTIETQYDEDGNEITSAQYVMVDEEGNVIEFLSGDNQGGITGDVGGITGDVSGITGETEGGAGGGEGESIRVITAGASSVDTNNKTDDDLCGENEELFVPVYDEEEEEEEEEENERRDKFSSERRSDSISTTGRSTRNIPDKLDVSGHDKDKLRRGGRGQERRDYRGPLLSGITYTGAPVRPLHRVQQPLQQPLQHQVQQQLQHSTAQHQLQHGLQPRAVQQVISGQQKVRKILINPHFKPRMLQMAAPVLPVRAWDPARSVPQQPVPRAPVQVPAPIPASWQPPRQGPLQHGPPMMTRGAPPRQPLMMARPQPAPPHQVMGPPVMAYQQPPGAPGFPPQPRMAPQMAPQMRAQMGPRPGFPPQQAGPPIHLGPPRQMGPHPQMAPRAAGPPQHPQMMRPPMRGPPPPQHFQGAPLQQDPRLRPAPGPSNGPFPRPQMGPDPRAPLLVRGPTVSQAAGRGVMMRPRAPSNVRMMRGRDNRVLHQQTKQTAGSNISQVQTIQTIVGGSTGPLTSGAFKRGAPVVTAAPPAKLIKRLTAPTQTDSEYQNQLKKQADLRMKIQQQKEVRRQQMAGQRFQEAEKTLAKTGLSIQTVMTHSIQVVTDRQTEPGQTGHVTSHVRETSHVTSHVREASHVAGPALISRNSVRAESMVGQRLIHAVNPQRTVTKRLLQTNRTVLAPGSGAPRCTVGVVHVTQLSRSTSLHRLEALAASVGPTQSLCLMNSGSARIQFTQPSDALKFYSRFNRKSLDNSVLQMTLS